MKYQIVQASETDKHKLAELRVIAMKDSLVAIGRFNPERARLRFLDSFSKIETWKIDINKQLAGFYVLKLTTEYLLLDHFYLHPNFQSKGIGSDIINNIKKDNSLPIKVGALINSKSNEFYLKHGFKKIAEDQWDNYYLYG